MAKKKKSSNSSRFDNLCLVLYRAAVQRSIPVRSITSREIGKQILLRHLHGQTVIVVDYFSCKKYYYYYYFIIVSIEIVFFLLANSI